MHYTYIHAHQPSEAAGAEQAKVPPRRHWPLFTAMPTLHFKTLQQLLAALLPLLPILNPAPSYSPLQ